MNPHYEPQPKGFRPGTNLKKPTLRERINNWIGMFLYRRIGVKAGPFMFHSRGQWWFVDHIGNVYILDYNAEGAYRHLPITITLFHSV
jgi:hypothetical protein